MKKTKQVYQFKITLKDVKPPIWRRIIVPGDYSFWDLHVAIQDSMGWHDCHLHAFRILNPATGMLEEIGIPDEDGLDDVYPGWKKKMARYFSLENAKATYEYDFGDGWEHSVLLEKIIPADKDVAYPICIKGKRACPPEDCGGPWGYMDFLDIISNPKDPEHDSMLEWVGGKFDPEHFNPEDVHFDDPTERLKALPF
jgi:hypothetical protein